jgi:hypothetical protein
MRAFALVLVLLAPAGAAYARPVLTLGLRVGGGVPYGRTAAAAALSDELRFTLPVTAELTFATITPRLSMGPFLQYAAGALSRSAPLGSGACSDTASGCSDGRVLRLGWQLVWNLHDSGRVSTWAAAGTAYQSLGYSARDSGGSGTVTYRGWEWLNVQLGANLLQRGRGRLGPYASASIGRFERVRLESGGDSLSGEIAKKTFHGWLQFGIRATVDL